MYTETFAISNEGWNDLLFEISDSYYSYANRYALQFDGVDDFVTIPDDLSLQCPTYFTVEAWGYLKSIPPYEYDHVPIVWRGNNIYGNDYHFRIAQGNGEGVITWGSVGQDGVEYWFDGGSIMSDEWYHFAYVVNGDAMSAYINGELVGSDSGNPPYIVSGYKTYVGYANRNGLNVYTEGIVDEIRIWNVPRTQAEIQQYMNKELNGTEEGLVGYWQFNEGIGDTAFDKTLNGNAGILQNGVQWVSSTAPVSPRWLFISPDSGICHPDTSLEIVISFDATELDSGDYYGSLEINSNDPFNSKVVIPVHMLVLTTNEITNEFTKPTAFSLFQNYPNPFNPSTKIKYSIPQSSNVVIKVFDVLGNEIETLVNEEKSTGTYEVTWYAEQLPSGVYFYQLKAGSFMETKKMILLK